MFAPGKTSVTEPSQSRDHTERMLEYFLVRPQKSELTVTSTAGSRPTRDFAVPATLSAGLAGRRRRQLRSHLLIKNVGSTDRNCVLGVLVRMGSVHEIIESEQPSRWARSNCGRARGVEIGGEIAT